MDDVVGWVGMVVDMLLNRVSSEIALSLFLSSFYLIPHRSRTFHPHLLVIVIVIVIFIFTIPCSVQLIRRV